MSGQINIPKLATHSTPPSGKLGYGFDALGNAVRINENGSTTILVTDVESGLVNIIANKGVDVVENLPTVGNFDQGDIFVSNDTYQVWTAISVTDWASVDLEISQFVTDIVPTASVLYQYTATDNLEVLAGGAVPAQNWVDFIPQDPIPAYVLGRIFYDGTENTWSAYNDIDGISLQLGEELRARLINDTGFDLLDGKAVSVTGAVGASLQVELLDASNLDSSIRAFGLMTITTIDGNPGYAIRYGAVRGLNTLGNTAGALVYGDPDNPGEWTSVRPTAPNYPVRIGVFLIIDEFEGVIGVDNLAFNGTDTTVNIEGALNGIITKKQSIDILVDTGVIYFETDNENSPTDDLPFVISEMRYFLNTTTGAGTGGKARVALTAGTATVPTTNYVYVLESAGAGVLTANTTGFPANSAPVAVCSVLDVTNTDTYGALVARRFNNAPNNGGGDGFFQYLSLRLRLEGSKYISGVDPTVAITTNPSAIDGLKVSSTSGIVFQMHSQTFQAKDGTEYYVVNHPTTPYLRITDLSDIDVDANGDSLRGNNTRYGLNLCGGQNSADEIDRVYILLPTGHYSTDTNAINDASNYAVTSVPFELRGTAFRTFRIVVNYSTASSGTFTNLLGAGGYQDERGQPLGVGGGGAGSGAAQTNFSDTDFSIYNNTDATKILQFLLSGITTGNTRTLTVPDKNGTIALLSDVGTGDMTKSIGNTFSSSLDVDKDQVWCSAYAQTGAITLANTFTNGVGSYLAAPITSNGAAWNFPAAWIKLKNEYLNDSSTYFLELLYDGVNVMYSFTRKENSLIVDFVTASIANDNTYIEFEINYSCYSDLALTAALVLADFDTTFAQNGGTATAWTATSITNNAGGALVGGETEFRIYGTLTGTADGNETVEVTPADGSSVVGSTELGAQYMESDKTSGAINLSTITGAVILEFDASIDASVTTAGGSVSLWEDQSTEGSDASQGSGTLQPSHNQANDYVQFTNADESYLNIGDILNLEFQDDDEFSILIECSNDVTTGSSYLLGNRTTDAGDRRGFYVGAFSGAMYMGLHDGSSGRTVTDSVDYSDYVMRKFIFTHLADGKMYMYDATNSQIASNVTGQLGSINYTSLESNLGTQNTAETVSSRFGDSRLRHLKVFDYVLDTSQRATELGL